MASLKKLEDTSPPEWQVRWRDPDRTQRKRNFPSRGVAQKFRRQVEECERLGVRWSPPDAKRVPDMHDLVVAYLDDKKRTLKENTLIRYARALELFERFLVQTRGRRRQPRVDILSKGLLREFYAWLDRPETGLHGRQRRKDSVRKQVEVVQLIWEWADNEDAYDGLIPRPKRIDMPRSSGKSPKAPTWAEMDRCIHQAKGWHQRLLVVMRFTGLRVSQVMRLRWSDIDLDACLLTIRGELGKTKQEGRGRVIPISTHLATLLDKWDRSTDRLIHVDNGRGGDPTRQARDKTIRAYWTRSAVNPDIWTGEPNHIFRKGFISGLKRAGADNEAVEHLVGHSRGALREVYADPNALPLREAVALIPALHRPKPTLVPAPSPSVATGDSAAG